MYARGIRGAILALSLSLLPIAGTIGTADHLALACSPSDAACLGSLPTVGNGTAPDTIAVAGNLTVCSTYAGGCQTVPIGVGNTGASLGTLPAAGTNLTPCPPTVGFGYIVTVTTVAGGVTVWLAGSPQPVTIPSGSTSVPLCLNGSTITGPIGG